MKFRYIIFLFLFPELLTAGMATVSADEADSVSIIRGPYLQCVSQTGIIIRWRTNLPTSSRVVFGTSIFSPDQEKTDKTDTTDHVIRLTGLIPDTKYFYRVGNEGDLYGDMDSLNYFVTSPTPLNEKPVRIWATGDFGTADSAARAVEQAYLNYRTDWHTDIWLMLGDNAYTRGSDEQYQEALFGGIYKELLGNTVMWPTPGNHDMRSADSDTQTGPYYDIFSLPENAEAGGVPSGTEAYYSFDYGNVHIISMDTEDTPVEKDSEMIRWLEKDLDANDLKWTIVFFHHPPYSMGTHNSDMHWDSGGRMTRIREYILPVLDAHGADLVLGGHSHVYERSYLIHDHYGRARTFKGKTMIRGRKKRYPVKYSKYDGESGIIYVVCGVSGGRPSAGRFQHPAMAFGSDQFRGSMSIEVSGDLLYGIFLDSKGEVRDWFRIEKKENSMIDNPGIGIKD